MTLLPELLSRAHSGADLARHRAIAAAGLAPPNDGAKVYSTLDGIKPGPGELDDAVHIAGRELDSGYEETRIGWAPGPEFERFLHALDDPAHRPIVVGNSHELGTGFQRELVRATGTGTFRLPSQVGDLSSVDARGATILLA